MSRYKNSSSGKGYLFFLIAFIAVSMALVNCGTKKETTKGDIKYSKGEHTISSVDRSYELLFGRSSGLYQLKAPLGYEIVDYDYDYTDDNLEFDDYVYKNVVPVTTMFNDFIGTPEDSNYSNLHADGIYQSGEHVLVDINRSIDLLWGKSDMMNLEAPEGYEVVDYDYDKTDSFAFENIVYKNTVAVKVENENSFGKPIEPIIKNESNNYNVGEQKLVTLTRNLNIWIGKNEKFGLTAPEGYSIVDYDYDKNDSIEFQTITYTNTVPVIKNGTNFGTPLEKVETESDYYKPGSHVIVVIDRSFNILYGKNETKELIPPKGYTLLDYDYEYGENFQFETYVYVNDESVQTNDINSFGRVIKK